MSPTEVQQRLAYGRRHLEFCMKLYELQWREGRYFLHEHPQVASSWNETCVKRLLSKVCVQRVIGDQCMYGLKTRDKSRVGLARQSIGFMINPPCVAKALSRRCPNTRNHQVHEHIRLESGRPKAAQVYPPELCRAICQGLGEQMEVDRQGQFLLAGLEGGNGKNGDKLMKASK